MTIEDQLKELRTADGKSIYDMQLKRSRITAFFLVGATVVSLMFFIFAFVQKQSAEALKAELLKTKQALEACQKPY